MLNFQVGGQSTKVFRHILTQRVDINYEFSKRDSQILVSPSIEAGPQLETDSIIDLFDVFESQNIIDAEKDVMSLFKEREVGGLFNDETIDEALQMFCETISPEGSYMDMVQRPNMVPKKPTETTAIIGNACRAAAFPHISCITATINIPTNKPSER